MFHADLKEKLETDTGVKFYPVYVPEKVTLPVCYYSVTNTVPEPNAEDQLGVPAKSVQIGIVASTYDDLQSTADSIFNSLNRFGGMMGETKVILSGMTNDRDESYDPELREFGRIMEFRILYSA